MAVITTKVRDKEGAYVNLLEYDDIEGFVSINNVSKKRISTVKAVLSEGKKEMMQVLRVDKHKMCIDLNKKNINPDDKDEAHKRYLNAKKVHIIMKQTARKLKVPDSELYEAWGWDLYDIFEHAYIAFRIILTDPEAVFSKIDIEPEQREALIDVLK